MPLVSLFAASLGRVWLGVSFVQCQPPGVLVSASDPQGRLCVMPDIQRHLGREHLMPVGRLDLNTEGLLLVSDSGRLVDQIFRSKPERIYRARVRGKVDESKLQSLQQSTVWRGVRYDGCQVRLLEPQTGSNAWLEVALRSGKNREVRNLLESVSLSVSRLIRITFGPYRLPRELEKGELMPVDNLFKLGT